MSDVQVDVAPDPATEIRIVTLHATRGINFWSRRPVVRMDLSVGRFDDISSADVPGFVDALMAVLPGLIEHECSLGARGGFRSRLRRGTYAPHIIEHVALELQTLIGHDVGYGRTRGGDDRGQYTIIFEHNHEQVGLRAAALALEVVQRAFAGTLEGVDTWVAELRTLSETPEAPPLAARVFCGVTGGANRLEAQEEFRRRMNGAADDRVLVDLSPAYMLQAGLPYSRSDMAIVLDADLPDVPERYQEKSQARRLMSIVADAVRRGGLVTCPAKEWEIQDYARDQDCRVAIFAVDDDVTWRDQRVAIAVGRVRDGHILLDYEGDQEDAGPLSDAVPPSAQVAAALSAFVVRQDGSR
jgi:cyanophycin synthetase